MSTAIQRAIQAENAAIAERAHQADVNEALDAAQLTIEEYYNGDREWAEAWLLKAAAANKAK
jgi:hypothetical protein